VLTAVTVVALSILSAQQTGAYWHDQTATGNDTIRSGELKILAAGTNNYAWNDFGGENLSPGSIVQKPVTISVAGSAGTGIKAIYRLQSMFTNSAEMPLTFTAWIVNIPGNCPGSGNPTNIVAGPWSSFPAPVVARSLAVGNSEVWCLRATVGATAAQGKKTTVTVGFRADQTL